MMKVDDGKHTPTDVKQIVESIYRSFKSCDCGMYYAGAIRFVLLNEHNIDMSMKKINGIVERINAGKNDDRNDAATEHDRIAELENKVNALIGAFGKMMIPEQKNGNGETKAEIGW